MNNTKTVVLFSTHIMNDYIHSQIKKLYNDIGERVDMYVLFQSDNGYECNLPTEIHVYPFTVDSLNDLAYEPWAETIVPGSNHFPVLQFFKEHPEYAYYWNIEYDVLFSGDWNVLFEWFEDKDEDFVSTHIETISEKPQWEHWNDIELKEDDNIDRSKFIKSFNPIYRISNKALAFIDSFLLKGNRGHHELLLPTVLNHNGFSIKDMGGSGNYTYEENDLFYTSDGTNTWYSDSSMRFRPLYHTDEVVIPNKLYHPIKETSGDYILGMDIIREYNSILNKTEWLFDKNFDLSGFAVDEAYMLYMLNALNKHEYNNLLDLGSGQSTLALSQYVKSFGTKLFAVESDKHWAVTLQKDHPSVEILSNIHIFNACINDSSMYISLTKDLVNRNMKFDFISVDGPCGFNCKLMSRINIIELIGNGLISEKFTIMFHDTNRIVERNTVNVCKSLLDELNVEYYTKEIHCGKGTVIITNIHTALEL